MPALFLLDAYASWDDLRLLCGCGHVPESRVESASELRSGEGRELGAGRPFVKLLIEGSCEVAEDVMVTIGIYNQTDGMLRLSRESFLGSQWHYSVRVAAAGGQDDKVPRSSSSLRS